MKKINFCTLCGSPLFGSEVIGGLITCSCSSVLDAYTGEVISRKDMENDCAYYPEFSKAE